jgi:hypothetical protein
MKQLSIIFALVISAMFAHSQAQLFGYKDYSFSNQVNIGGGSHNTNPAAFLEIGPVSTNATKGILFPRGKRDSIPAPVTGLLIYDIQDLQVYQYNGSAWEKVGGTAPAPAVIPPTQKQFASVIAPYHTGNVRNDAVDVQQISGDTLLAVYSRFANGSSDYDPATIYGSFSYDKGITWQTPFAVVATVAGSQKVIPSLYKRGSTWVCVYHDYTGSTFTLKKVESTNGGVTWGTESVAYTYTGYPAPAAGRVMKLKSGKYILPSCINTNGILESVGGQYKGILLYSNDGVTWAKAAVEVVAANGFVGEPGCMEKQGSIIYYWRNNQGYSVPYVTISDTAALATHTSELPTGIRAPNSTTSIIYDSDGDIFFAVHNRVAKALATTTTDVNDRLYMDISVAWHSFDNGWQNRIQVDYQPNKHFFEPHIMQLGDQVLVAYSDGESVSGTFQHNLLAKRFPTASLLPQMVPVNYTQNVDFKPVKQWWQTGSSTQIKIANFGLGAMKTDDAHYQINVNRNTGDVGFVPEFDIKSYGTSRGVDTYMDLANLDAAEPFNRIYYKRNGTTPGSGYILQEHNVNGASVYQLMSDGQVILQNRVTLKSFTQAQMNAMPSFAAGQLLFNSDSAKVQVYNGTSWISLGSSTGGSSAAHTLQQTIDAGATLDKNNVIDAAGFDVKFSNLYSMTLERAGNSALFMKNTTGGTDSKWWGLYNYGSSLQWWQLTDGGSGLQEYLRLEKGSPNKIVASVLTHIDAPLEVVNPSSQYVAYFKSSAASLPSYLSIDGQASGGVNREAGVNLLGGGSSKWFFGISQAASNQNFKIENYQNSTTPFQIDGATGDVILAKQIQLGTYSAAPTGTNGGLYYNTTSNVFQGYQNGSWATLLTTTNGVQKLTGSATIDFPLVGNLSSSSSTITVTGAAVGDQVLVTKQSTGYSNGEMYRVFVSATNTVTVTLQNVSGGNMDLSSDTYNVTVIK